MTLPCLSWRGKCPQRHVSDGRGGCPWWRKATSTDLATGAVSDASGCAPDVHERQIDELIKAVALLTAEASAMRQGAQAQVVQMAERRLMDVAAEQERLRIGADG